jgi:hypothetical protein
MKPLGDETLPNLQERATPAGLRRSQQSSEWKAARLPRMPPDRKGTPVVKTRNAQSSCVNADVDHQRRQP